MFKLRDATPSDLPFILSSWLRRYRDAINVKLVTDRVYYEKQHQVISRILQTPGLKAVIACDPTDDNFIYGWCVGEQLADNWMMLHFVYVKHKFRRFTVATKLLEKVVGTCDKIQYSHYTKLVDVLDKQQSAVYVPSYVWAMVDK